MMNPDRPTITIKPGIPGSLFFGALGLKVRGLEMTGVEEGLYPQDGRYHFVGPGGSQLWISKEVPLVPVEWMVETVREEDDAHPFVEYGPNDEAWRHYFGFVRYVTRPRRDVLIMDGFDGQLKPTRALYAHPETIELIRQVGRVVTHPTYFQGV